MLPPRFFWLEATQGFMVGLSFPGGSEPAMQETWIRSLGQEDPLENEMATHSGILAWKISGIEKPGRLQSMRWQRVRHD